MAGNPLTPDEMTAVMAYLEEDRGRLIVAATDSVSDYIKEKIKEAAAMRPVRAAFLKAFPMRKSWDQRTSP